VATGAAPTSRRAPTPSTTPAEERILPYTAAPAADIELSAAELAEIDTIVADAVPVWGPHPEGM
jgi:hypothetical protein